MKDELIREYEGFLKHDKQKLQEIRRQIQLLSFLRLVAFCMIVLSLIFFRTLGSGIAILLIAISTVLFFFWIKKFIQKEKMKLLYANLIEINEKELKALDEDYSVFDGGDEFVDPNHSFSFDLDIFGEGSVFQFLNRTTTQLGKKKLAFKLQNPIISASTLEKKQQALLELAQYTRWRQLFAAKGKMHDEDDLKLLESFSSKINLPNQKIAKTSVYILPVLGILFLTACSFAGLPWFFLIFILLINGGILVYFSSTIKKSYRIFGRQSNILERYCELFILVENKTFESIQLNELKQLLFSQNKPASQILRSLQKVMAAFDYRQNLLVGFVLNAFLLWDLKCVLKLYHWQQENKENIHHWFDVVAGFDALSSLANMNHNHPEWALPNFEKDEFHYSADNLAHPLIKSAKRVGNSFRLKGDGKLLIVTGANMAGKSTFLRALGVNILLALNACRTCASRMTLKPVGVFSNMRTTDNLQKDESYFYAELLRLQMMLEKIKNGEKLFILIDEMLKGTNSKDKLLGSKELIKQLLRLDIFGVLATHDLDLTRLSDDYPGQVFNRCFDVKLEGNDLTFDYKLSKGVTRTMNASFLMKKMGIIPGDRNL